MTTTQRDYSYADYMRFGLSHLVVQKPSQPPLSSGPGSCHKSSNLGAPHDPPPKLSRPQEDAESYDFIIKEADRDAIDDTENLINRFLRRAWELSNLPSTKQRRLDGESSSPLIYHRHYVCNADGSVHVAVSS